MSFIRKLKKNGKVYLAEVESTRIKGKVVQRYIRYVGREADGKTILSASMSDVQIDAVKLYGPLLVLHHLAQEIGLNNLLGEHAQEILAMVYAHCVDYKSINQMPSWFERTDLNVLLSIDGLTEERLLDALDSLEAQNPEILQKKIFQAVAQEYELKPNGVIYDVTNTYLYGKKCPFGKLGHDKRGIAGSPLIQIGLGVTQEEGIPLFHKVFDGNVADARTLQDLISSFHGYNIDQGLLVYDRGITSGRNLKDIKDLGWDTLCGVPLHEGLKRFWKPILVREELVDFKNRIRLGKTIFYVIARPYQIDSVKGSLVLCFNEQLRKDIRESRYDEIQKAQELLGENKKIKEGLEKYLDRKGKLIYATLQEAEKWDGYSCVFCTRRLPSEKLIRLYFDKDLVEKAFRSIKGITNLQPIRSWLAQRVIAHVFLCYLAYLLLSLLKLRLKKIGISSEEALRELGTMYKVYMRDSKNHFKISRTVTLNKKQELILKTISKKLLS